MIVERLARAIGVQPLRALPWHRMASAVLRVRNEADIELVLAAGAPQTTPDLKAIEVSWPAPWVFGRLLVLAVVIYLALLFAWTQSANRNLIPGLILAGSFAVPVPTLVLFFECNIVRNVSLYQCTRLMLLGGVLALVFTLFMYQLGALFPIQWVGSSIAGLIEEPAKLLALAIVINNPRYRFTLNGLVLGAAVGTGFAAFETAGYAFRAGLEGGSAAMGEVILTRGLLAPLAHIVWTAVTAAALWRVKRDAPFSWGMLREPRFRRVFTTTILLHIIWDSATGLPNALIYLLVGLVGWYMVVSLLQEGLDEVRWAQAHEA